MLHSHVRYGILYQNCDRKKQDLGFFLKKDQNAIQNFPNTDDRRRRSVGNLIFTSFTINKPTSVARVRYKN